MIIFISLPEFVIVVEEDGPICLGAVGVILELMIILQFDILHRHLQWSEGPWPWATNEACVGHST